MRLPGLRRRTPDRSCHAELARIAELEQRLDHERLFPAQWANRRVRDHYGTSVIAGPFAGLTYSDSGITDVDLFAPKLLGIFERELHASVERLIEDAPSQVVNIGAADGYYAVGVARRVPGAQVVAFEQNESLHPLLRDIAERNEVSDRIRIEGACDAPLLATVLQPGAWIVCDCEGCERDLLDLDQVPALANCSLIVETHDLLAEGVTRLLRERFATTHEVTEIATEPRYVGDFPQLDFMPLVTRQLAISEFRSAPMSWLVLQPS